MRNWQEYIGLWVACLGALYVIFDFVGASSPDTYSGSVTLGALMLATLNVGAFLLMACLAWLYVPRQRLGELIIPINTIGLLLLRDHWMTQVEPDAQSAIAEWVVIPIYLAVSSLPLTLLFFLLARKRSRLGTG